MRTFLAMVTLSLVLGKSAAALELISASPTGISGSYPSQYPAISGNGRYVVWGSGASNLLADITACAVPSQPWAVYLRDNLTKVTEVVSQSGNPVWIDAPAVSPTGRYVAYGCGVAADICVLDRVLAATEEVATHSNDHLRVSADGRFLAYRGPYTQFSPSDPGYNSQIWVYDRCVSDGTPVGGCSPGKQVVSVNASGTAANYISEFPDMTDDGRYVAFSSQASNLVPGVTSGNNIFVRDRCVTTSGLVPSCTPSTRRVSVADDGSSPNCYPAGAEVSISNDGRYVAFSHCGDLVPEVTGNEFHIYVRDRDVDGNGIFDEPGPGNTRTELVSRASGASGDPGDFGSSAPEITGDGRYVAFVSGAKNLYGPTESDFGNDVYLRDRVAQTTKRMSESPSGQPSLYLGTFGYITGSISDDGHVGVFYSSARNLLQKSQNSYNDVYLWADCAAAAPTCGDGTVYYGCEECDDGDLIDETNGCDSNCRRTGCPNGVVTTGEVCDDGNRVSGDGCDTNCTPTACGNGIRTAGEACDDGNTIDGDGCSSTCTFELSAVVPGGGKATTDCWHEWRTEPAPAPDTKGLPRRELRCTDDNPSCDFGASTGDKACTFHVALCFNVEDSRLIKDGVQQCATNEIETLHLTNPKQDKPKDAAEAAIRDAFEAKFQEVGACVSGMCIKPTSSANTLCDVNADCDSGTEPGDGVCAGRLAVLYNPITATNGCTGYMDIVVPLKLRNGVYAKGKRVLAVLMEPTLDPVTFMLRKGDSDKLTLTCLPPP